MLKQIDRLTSIVETLLRSARQSATAVDAIRFDAAVAKAARDWAELRDWPASNLHLEAAPCKVLIVEEEVGIVVRNLLENGAQHSAKDSVLEVGVSTLDGFVRLTVRDYGSGLTHEEAVKAFERFYRSDEGRGREDAAGAGVGLAVVKRIAESHGGKVGFLPVEVGALVEWTLPAVD